MRWGLCLCMQPLQWWDTAYIFGARIACLVHQQIIPGGCLHDLRRRNVLELWELRYWHFHQVPELSAGSGHYHWGVEAGIHPCTSQMWSSVHACRSHGVPSLETTTPHSIPFWGKQWPWLMLTCCLLRCNCYIYRPCLICNTKTTISLSRSSNNASIVQIEMSLLKNTYSASPHRFSQHGIRFSTHDISCFKRTQQLKTTDLLMLKFYTISPPTKFWCTSTLLRNTLMCLPHVVAGDAESSWWRQGDWHVSANRTRSRCWLPRHGGGKSCELMSSRLVIENSLKNNTASCCWQRALPNIQLFLNATRTFWWLNKASHQSRSP